MASGEDPKADDRVTAAVCDALDGRLQVALTS